MATRFLGLPTEFVSPGDWHTQVWDHEKGYPLFSLSNLRFDFQSHPLP